MAQVDVNLRTHAKKAEVYEQTQTNEKNQTTDYLICGACITLNPAGQKLDHYMVTQIK